MSSTQKPGDERRSLPDDIAVAAGMPRGEFGSRTVGEDARSAASDLGREAADLRDRAANAAWDARSEASDKAGAVRDRVGETVDDLRGRASDTYEDARDWASETRESGRRRFAELSDRGVERLQDGKSVVEDFVTENPLLVGVVGLAAGLLIGALLPRTRSEDRTVGPWADEIRDQGFRYARDVTHRGREFVASALDPENLNAAVQRATDQGPATSANDVPPPKPH